eukprot:1382614-Ditylum_brightwellii.AAC.1
MERRGLLCLQRTLRVNGYNANDSKHWKNVAEEGGAPNCLDSCGYPNTSGSIIFYFNPYKEQFTGTDLIIFNETNGGKG